MPRGRPCSSHGEPARTLVTVTTGVEGMDDPEKLEFLTRMMQLSVANVKALVEADRCSQSGEPGASEPRLAAGLSGP
jgi:hypothetical protein